MQATMKSLPLVLLVAVIAMQCSLQQVSGQLSGGRQLPCDEKDPSIELDPWVFLDRDYDETDAKVDLCLRFFCNNGKVDLEKRFWSTKCNPPKTPEEWKLYESQAEIRASNPTPRPIWTPPPRHPDATLASRAPQSSTTTPSPSLLRRSSSSTTSTTTARASSSSSTTSTTTTTAPPSTTSTSTTTTQKPTSTSTTRPRSSSHLTSTTTRKPSTTSTTTRKPTTSRRRSQYDDDDEDDYSNEGLGTHAPPVNYTLIGHLDGPQEEDLDYSGLPVPRDIEIPTTTEIVYELYDEDDPTWKYVPKSSEEVYREQEERRARVKANQEAYDATTTTTTESPHRRRPQPSSSTTTSTTTLATTPARTPSRITPPPPSSSTTTSTTTRSPETTTTTTTEKPEHQQSWAYMRSNLGRDRDTKPQQETLKPSVSRFSSLDQLLRPIKSNRLQHEDQQHDDMDSPNVQASTHMADQSGFGAYFNWSHHDNKSLITHIGLVLMGVFIISYVSYSVVYIITRRLLLSMEAKEVDIHMSMPSSPPSRQLRTRFDLSEV